MEYHVDAELVKVALVKSLQSIPEVRATPNPICFISETTESWLLFKLDYYIDNYGSQYSIGDKVVAHGLQALRAQGLKPTVQSFKVATSMPEAVPV